MLEIDSDMGQRNRIFQKADTKPFKRKAKENKRMTSNQEHVIN